MCFSLPHGVAPGLAVVAVVTEEVTLVPLGVQHLLEPAALNYTHLDKTMQNCHPR